MASNEIMEAVKNGFSMTLAEYKDFAQISFYVVTGIVAVLTYKNAKKSIFSSVNSDYQKRVFDRLSEVTSKICSEFRLGNDEYYLYNMPMEKALKEIVGEYNSLSEQDRTNGDYFVTDVPANPETIKFGSLYDEVAYDPYIPQNNKKVILVYIQWRLDACEIAYGEAIDGFVEYINKEKPCQIGEDDYEIHNYYIQSLDKLGRTSEKIEERAREISDDFQRYMGRFEI